MPTVIGNVPPPMPTRLTWPDIAIVAAARASVWSVPTKSNTTVAPRAPTASRSSAAARPSPSSATSAPASSARRRDALAHVDGDDPGRRERAQQLHGDVAEATDADHDG